MEEFSLTRDGPGRYDDVSSQVLDPSFQCQITHCVPSYPVVVGGDNIYEYQMIRCYFHCCARSYFSSDELARRERIVACPMRIMTTTLSKPVKTRGEADALFDSWCKSPSDDWQRRFEATIHSARYDGVVTPPTQLPEHRFQTVVRGGMEIPTLGDDDEDENLSLSGIGESKYFHFSWYYFFFLSSSLLILSFYFLVDRGLLEQSR